jgi:CHRD domain/PEP-CTERM motif
VQLAAVASSELSRFVGAAMKPSTVLAAGSLAALLVSTPAAAVTIVYNIALSGTESVPVNVTPASGAATVTVDDVADTVSVNLSWSGLIGGSPSAAHIHCCVATNANGPVVIPFTDFPTTTSGTYSNTFTGISAANIAGIEAGLAYINIHNAVFPGGEIRGDILSPVSPVPEPESLALMLAGLGALAMYRTRRARAKAARA